MGGGTSTPEGQDPSDFEERQPPSGVDDSVTDSERDTSQTGSQGRQLSSHDRAEMESMSDSFEMDIGVNYETPSPKEFAEEHLHEGVRARRIEAGFDGHRTDFGSRDKRIGGWDNYDPSEIESRTPLSETDQDSGRKVAHMSKIELKDSDGRAANVAYATSYDPEEMRGVPDLAHTRMPTRSNAHSQMASYAALDAMGVDVPAHTYDIENNEVVVESVSREGYDAMYVEDVDANHPYANKIDPDQVKDMMAANLVVGNGDLSEDNLMVGEDGRVVAFDLDYTRTTQTLARAKSEWSHFMDSGLDSIDEVRDGGLDVETSDVLDRAEELADELDETGMVHRVAEAASRYDSYFSEGGRSEGLDEVGARVYTHVKEWTDKDYAEFREDFRPDKDKSDQGIGDQLNESGDGDSSGDWGGDNR